MRKKEGLVPNVILERKRGKLYSGFTLIELLVAVAIFSTIAVVLYSCFRGGVISWRRIESEQSYQQKVRGLFSAIEKDFRNMLYISNIPFEGSADRVSFTTCANLYKEGVSNVNKVSYFLMPGEEGNSSGALARKEEDLIDVLSVLEAEPEEEEDDIQDELLSQQAEEGKSLLEGVSAIRFNYLLVTEAGEGEEEDGSEYEWVEIWEEEDALPRGIKIEIDQDGSEQGEEATFSRRIWIPSVKDDEGSSQQATESSDGLSGESSEGLPEELPEELPEG